MASMRSVTLCLGEIELAQQRAGVLVHLAVPSRRRRERRAHDVEALLDRVAEALVALVHALGEGDGGVVDVLHDGVGLLVLALVEVVDVVEARVDAGTSSPCRRARSGGSRGSSPGRALRHRPAAP